MKLTQLQTRQIQSVKNALRIFGIEDIRSCFTVDIFVSNFCGRSIRVSDSTYGMASVAEYSVTGHESPHIEDGQYAGKVAIVGAGDRLGYVQHGCFYYEEAPDLRTALGWMLATELGGKYSFEAYNFSEVAAYVEEYMCSTRIPRWQFEEFFKELFTDGEDPPRDFRRKLEFIRKIAYRTYRTRRAS